MASWFRHIAVAFSLVLCSAGVPARAQPTVEAPAVVYAAEVDSIIQPVSAEYMIETMAAADRAGAALVVFTLRTPGGLVDSTRDIVSKMLAATAPVAIFIAPSGSRAASAGFILTIAADVAAMAPGTHIGAAHPVSGNGEPINDTVAKKAEEDVAAYARTLASGRHRNVDLAVEAVRASRAFTETEALGASPPLIDLIAPDLPTLLDRLDGRTIRRFDGRSLVLKTAGARVIHTEMSWRQRVLSAVAHPNVAYALLSLGMLGLMIELWTPGAVLPGVVGALALLLASLGLQLLPVNYTGLLLLLLGAALFALEVKVTSYGLLSAGGLVSFLFGSLVLMDTGAPELQVSLRLIVPIVLGCAAIGAFLVRLVVTSQRSVPVSGASGLIGQTGEVLTAIEPGRAGSIAAHGEIWRAIAAEPLLPGARVRILSIEGLTLTVRQE